MTQRHWCRRRTAGIAMSLAALTVAVTACGSTSSHHMSASSPASPPTPDSTASTANPTAGPSLKSLANVKRSHLPTGVLAEIDYTSGVNDYVDGPAGMVAGFGSLWIESHRSPYLERINGRTDATEASIDLNQDSCALPAIGFGRVWVQPCDDSTKTVVIDPKTNQVAGSFRGGGGMAFADGAAWVPTYNQKALQRINPRTLKVEASVKTFGDDVVFDGRYLWSLDVNSENGACSGILTKINPRTDKVVGHIRTPETSHHQSVAGPYTYLLYAYGSLWLTGNNAHAHLVQVNLASDKASVHPIAHLAYANFTLDRPATAGLGSVWVRASSARVDRISPATGETVASYRTDSQGDGGYPYIAFGSLWTTNFLDNSVWRIRVPIR